MSDSQISDKLAALKRARELREKPFPVWALLILYENSNARDTYCNYFEGFKLLVEWLSPIELTPHSEPLHKLQRSYEIQELATILQTTQENLNHAYQTALNILQLTEHFDRR
jgi:hypothetical protein